MSREHGGNAGRGSGEEFWNRSRTFALFMVPGLLLYSVFFIGPILMGFYYSLTDWNGFSRRFRFIGLRNFAETLVDERFHKALLFNLRYSMFLVTCIVVLGIALALLLDSDIKGRRFFRAAYFFPAVLSMLTVGLIFNQIFYRALPPIGRALGIPFLSRSLLARPDTAMFGILVVHVWQGVALPTVLFLAGLQTVPQELHEAATLDGASAVQRFLGVTFPFLLPVLSVVLVLAFKSGIMVFDYVMSLTSGGPAGSTESISLLIYRHGFTENQFSYSIAEAMVAGFLILAVSAVQISLLRRRRVVL